MVYAVLLRGINVGGNRTVSMAELKLVLEKLGLQNVKTLINSGNVIFSTDNPELLTGIEPAIEKAFAMPTAVFIRNLNEMQVLVGSIATAWVNDQTMKCDVLILDSSIDKLDILDQLPIKPEIEDVVYQPGAVVWRVDRANATKSRLSKIVGTKIYQHITIRNVNTIRKIYEQMRTIGEA
jgi:uncharacterized protein (DUF1697 family)